MNDLLKYKFIYKMRVKHCLNSSNSSQFFLRLSKTLSWSKRSILAFSIPIYWVSACTWFLHTLAGESFPLLTTEQHCRFQPGHLFLQYPLLWNLIFSPSWCHFFSGSKVFFWTQVDLRPVSILWNGYNIWSIYSNGNAHYISVLMYLKTPPKFNVTR